MASCFFLCDYKKIMIHKKAVLIFLCIWKGLEAFNEVCYMEPCKNGELYKVGISLCKNNARNGFIFIVNKLTHESSLCYHSIMHIFHYYHNEAMIFCKLENFTTTRKNRKKHIMHIYQKEFFLFINAFFTMYILKCIEICHRKLFNKKTYKLFFGIILMPASILPLFAQFIVAPTD